MCEFRSDIKCDLDPPTVAHCCVAEAQLPSCASLLSISTQFVFGQSGYFTEVPPILATKPYPDSETFLTRVNYDPLVISALLPCCRFKERAQQGRNLRKQAEHGWPCASHSVYQFNSHTGSLLYLPPPHVISWPAVVLGVCHLTCCGDPGNTWLSPDSAPWDSSRCRVASCSLGHSWRFEGSAWVGEKSQWGRDATVCAVTLRSRVSFSDSFTSCAVTSFYNFS